MKTAHPKYKVMATLREKSNNHPYAYLIAVLDTENNQLFAVNTCDVHLRKAPWDGGRPSHYTHEEINERLLMLKNHRG